MSRREELAAGLAAVHSRIARACDAAGRDPDGVTLVVVTKYFPASDVRLLADLGVADVGENRHQEAEAKFEECRLTPSTSHRVPESAVTRTHEPTSPPCVPPLKVIIRSSDPSGSSKTTALEESVSTANTPPIKRSPAAAVMVVLPPAADVTKTKV